MRKNPKLFVLMAMCYLPLMGCAGCGCNYVAVPPQYAGRILAPTGWEDKIYGPGQVDIGTVASTGIKNQLVLIQTSAFTVKESFLGAQANEDKEDHRVLTSDQTPVSLDIRLMFTSPDVDQEKEAMKRLFALGNPKKTSTDRVMEVNLADLYKEQAELHIRGKIRVRVSEYDNFRALFQDQTNLNESIAQTVAGVLKGRNIPLTLVEAQISNLKADPLVYENMIRLQAAETEIKAMRMIQEYLDQNPTARIIFWANKLKEIADTASAKGNNFVVISTLEGPGMPTFFPQNQSAER